MRIFENPWIMELLGLYFPIIFVTCHKSSFCKQMIHQFVQTLISKCHHNAWTQSNILATAIHLKIIDFWKVMLLTILNDTKIIWLNESTKYRLDLLYCTIMELDQKITSMECKKDIFILNWYLLWWRICSLEKLETLK